MELLSLLIEKYEQEHGSHEKVVELPVKHKF